MKRKYWYVSEDQGNWYVREGWHGLDDDLGSGQDAKSDAVREACEQAKKRHEETGAPTGVRVQGLDRRWWDEFAYGAES